MEYLLTRGSRTWKLLGVAALLAMLMTTLNLVASSRDAHATTATSVYDWDIEDYGWGYVYPGYQSYALRNLTASNLHNPYVIYGSRDYGINLVWSSRPSSPNIMFQRLSGTGPLKYGEPVAIYVSGGGYLRYGSRTFGINLVWSSTPVYEWRIYGEGKRTGESIQSAGYTRVGLYNMTQGQYVVYGTRSYGINLVWMYGAVPTNVATAALAFRGGTPGNCGGYITFKLTPVSLTGGNDGISWPYQVSTLGGSSGYDYCYWSVNAVGLTTGTWRIDADVFNAYGSTVSCQVFLGGGVNYVNFTSGRAGCGAGVYP